MNWEASGLITEELPITTGVTRENKDWEKREYIVEIDERYHTKMKFSIYSWDGPIENPPKVGDKVTFYFTIKARKYKDAWFNEVEAYRFE